MRESGWDNLFDEARQFCDLNGIPIPNMDEEIPVRVQGMMDLLLPIFIVIVLGFSMLLLIKYVLR